MGLLAPKLGVMSWRDFEHGMGWSNFFVLATSLSLANALMESGAGSWLATGLIQHVPVLQHHPLLVVLGLLVAATPIRLLIPNITAFWPSPSRSPCPLAPPPASIRLCVVYW